MRTFRTFTVLMAGVVAVASLMILGLPGGLRQNTPGEAASVLVQPVDLGTLGGGYSSASAVNNNGQVVGDSHTASGQQRAFSWTQAGGMVDLGTLGGGQSYAEAVNGSGQVVGGSTASGAYRAFSWTQAGGMVDLGTLGGGWSYAVAVNGSGQVVGYSSTASGGHRAFSWTQAGGMIDLGALGLDHSVARAVNGSGQVVGYSYTASGAYRAFSWTQAGGMIDLGTLGGGSSYAAAVNGSGQVVGYSSTASGERRAFSWTQAGGMIDLGTLGGSSYATAVNGSGQVVGSSHTASGEAHAFSWTQAGGMIDLGTLGGYTTAVAVNGSGQVVGYSYTASSGHRAFSWTQAGGMVDLGTLGGGSSYAVAVNDGGQVVGQSHTALGEAHATLWNTQAPAEPPLPPEPPAWSPSTGSLTVHAGDDAAVFLDADDPNPGDTVTITNVNDLPIGMTCTYTTGNRATGECHWTPTEAQLGTHLVDFVATDSGGLQSPIHTVTIEVIARLPVYLAIGDSVATGCSMESNPEEMEKDCPKAIMSYPQALRDYWGKGDLPGLQLEDLTRWGQTAKYFAEGGGRSDVERALDRKPEVVTITLGANDFKFADFAYWLLGRDRKWQESVVSDHAGLVELRLEKLIRLIRLKSPEAVVFVTGYPNPFTPGDCETARRYGDLLLYNTGNRDGLNDALKRVAGKFTKTYFVPLDNKGFQQHTMASKSSWYFGTQCQLDVKTAVYCGAAINRPLCDPHPNQDGAFAIAERIRTRLIKVPNF